MLVMPATAPAAPTVSRLSLLPVTDAPRRDGVSPVVRRYRLARLNPPRDVRDPLAHLKRTYD
jgi:hypothetical protein